MLCDSATGKADLASRLRHAAAYPGSSRRERRNRERAWGQVPHPEPVPDSIVFDVNHAANSEIMDVDDELSAQQHISAEPPAQQHHSSHHHISAAFAVRGGRETLEEYLVRSGVDLDDSDELRSAISTQPRDADADDQLHETADSRSPPAQSRSHVDDSEISDGDVAGFEV